MLRPPAAAGRSRRQPRASRESAGPTSPWPASRPPPSHSAESIPETAETVPALRLRSPDSRSAIRRDRRFPLPVKRPLPADEKPSSQTASLTPAFRSRLPHVAASGLCSSSAPRQIWPPERRVVVQYSYERSRFGCPYGSRDACRPRTDHQHIEAPLRIAIHLFSRPFLVRIASGSFGNAAFR